MAYLETERPWGGVTHVWHIGSLDTQRCSVNTHTRHTPRTRPKTLNAPGHEYFNPQTQTTRVNSHPHYIYVLCVYIQKTHSLDPRHIHTQHSLQHQDTPTWQRHLEHTWHNQLMQWMGTRVTHTEHTHTAHSYRQWLVHHLHK